MRLFFHELAAQQRIFWRSREAAFFTFLLPIIFLVLLGSIYGDRDTIGGVNAGTYLLAGLLGYGIVSTAFAGLAIQLVVRRESGVLKRVRGTPLPPRIYMSAVIGSTLLVIGLEAVVQLLIAGAAPYSPALISLSVPSTPTRSRRTSTPRPFGISSSDGMGSSARWTESFCPG